MKNRRFYLLSVLVILFITICSCKDDREEPSNTFGSITFLSTEDTQPVFPSQGGTTFLSFTATGDWTAALVNTRADGWITISPASGGKGEVEIGIITEANDTFDERNATIVLKCGTDTKNIVVTQKQKDALTVTSSKYEVERKGGNISIEVKANIEFEVEIKSDWIKQIKDTRALATSNLNFSIEPNETEEKREGEIIIKSGELSETVKVYQGNGDFITLTQKDFTLPEEGGNVDVEIKSTLDYEVKMLSEVDWITEIQTRAISTHTRHYEIAPNESDDSREAKIVFYNPKDESIADTISIYQMYKGAILVARDEYRFDNKGGTLNFKVVTNVEMRFDVVITGSWIRQVEPTRALMQSDLSFIISENAEQKDREGKIIIKDKNSEKQQVVTVKQTDRDLEREALIALYKATNGDNWTNNTNWCSDKPLNEWYGVSTNNNDRVHSLILDSNNLSGILPKEIGNLQALEHFSASNNDLRGPIPESIGNLLKLKIFVVDKNNLTGALPTTMEKLEKLAAFCISFNNIEGAIPENIGRLTELDWFMASSNNLSGTIPESVKHLKKMRIFQIDYNNIEGTIPEGFADLPLLEKLELSGNHLSGPIPSKLWKCSRWDSWFPVTNIFFQKPGYKLSMEDCYVSTDFFEDKKIIALQKHEEGNGIKLVLMGDLFVDTDIKNGTYEKVMREAMEHYFSIEPFKSLRKYFDVIAIKAVSKHNWLSGETAFQSTAEWDSGVIENLDKCLEYAQIGIGENNLENVQIILVNNYVSIGGGHCKRYSNGISIASCPYSKNEPKDFKETIHCLAGGYGFGHLQPEYIESEDTFSDCNGLQQEYNNYGWNANVDCTADPTKVRWAHFIKDPRYANEGLGIFEGAFYRYGIYRATENSILREQPFAIDWFNAPSREAIYKRAMKLAYGDTWIYDYEKFVEFDAPARTSTLPSQQQLRASKKVKHFPPIRYNYPRIVK